MDILPSYCVVFLLLVLLGFCQPLEDTLFTWINETSEDGPVFGWLFTPGFPGPFTHWGIHSYMLYNTYSQGRVQITCTDFDTPDEDFMYLKIYDGESYSSSPSYVFGYGSNPVFHSTGQILRLVFKPGHSGWWEQHRGIRLKYNFVSYDREDWHLHEMPSTGFCPFVALGENEGQMRIVGVPYNGQYYPMDCHWVLRSTDGMIYVNVIQVSFDTLNGSHSIEFLSGYSGGELLAAFSSTPPSSLNSVALVYDLSAIYVHLYGFMENSIIEFAYSNSHPRVTNSYASFANHPLGECPYKHNQYSYGNLPECLDYWDVQYYSDASCDTYHYLNADVEFQPECPLTGRCYGAHDKCDGFDDCGLGEEEQDCPEVSSSHELDVASTYFLLLGAMLLIFLVLKTKLDHIRRTSGSLSWRTVGAECRRNYERCLIVICTRDPRRLTRVQKFFAPYCKCLDRSSSSSNDTQNAQTTNTRGSSHEFTYEDPGGTSVGDRSSVTVILSAHILLDELRQARDRPSAGAGESPPAYDETWLHTSPATEGPTEPPPPSYDEAIQQATSGDTRIQTPPPSYESLS